MSGTFDRLMTSAPVNRQAAMHLSKAGEHYVEKPNSPGELGTSDGALPVLAVIPAEVRCKPSFTDFTGKRFGRVVVLGMLDAEKIGFVPGRSATAQGARWVVRCVCGRYEVRRTKTLREALPRSGMCRHCDHQAEVKAGRAPAPAAWGASK